MSAAGHGPVRTVVAGVDGSEAALEAVRWAAREAARRDAPLLLVNATSIVSLYSSSTTVPMFDEAVRAIDQDSARILDEARAAAESVGATDVRRHTDPEPPAAALRAASRSARLLVLGAAGRGHVGTALGSVTLTVASHAECPVVVVRGHTTDDTGPIVVGVDGGPLSDTALAHAFDEASVRRTGLTALHAWNDSDVARGHLAHYFELEAWEGTRDVEERALAERLAGWSARYPDVQVQRRIEQDDPAGCLVAASAGAGLVVVATRGRGGFSGLLLGSTGLRLIQDAACPVLLVGPEAAPLP